MVRRTVEVTVKASRATSRVPIYRARGRLYDRGTVSSLYQYTSGTKSRGDYGLIARQGDRKGRLYDRRAVSSCYQYTSGYQIEFQDRATARVAPTIEEP